MSDHNHSQPTTSSSCSSDIERSIQAKEREIQLLQQELDRLKKELGAKANTEAENQEGTGLHWLNQPEVGTSSDLETTRPSTSQSSAEAIPSVHTHEDEHEAFPHPPRADLPITLLELTPHGDYSGGSLREMRTLMEKDVLLNVPMMALGRRKSEDPVKSLQYFQRIEELCKVRARGNAADSRVFSRRNTVANVHAANGCGANGQGVMCTCPPGRSSSLRMSLVSRASSSDCTLEDDERNAHVDHVDEDRDFTSHGTSELSSPLHSHHHPHPYRHQYPYPFHPPYPYHHHLHHLEQHDDAEDVASTSSREIRFATNSFRSTGSRGSEDVFQSRGSRNRSLSPVSKMSDDPEQLPSSSSMRRSVSEGQIPNGDDFIRSELNFHCLKLAIAATSEGITLSDPRLPGHPLIFVNAGFERLTGYSAGEVVGMNCRFLQGPMTDRAEVGKISSAIREHREYHGEIVNYTKDGRPFWNYLSLTPVFADDGQLVNYVGVQYDISERKRLELALEEEKRRSEKLLLNILPAAIARELKDNGSAIAKHHDHASILFADIVGFTTLSSTMDPDELVCVLDGVFSVFDDLADKYDLEKIKTIGDAYMAASGLLDVEGGVETTAAACSMALDMLNGLAAYNANSPAQPALQVRIGINVGPVVAGVIGKKKFKFDVWGDTVNVASRMESHGEAGRIQVTEAVYGAVGHLFCFEQRGVVDVKGKGPMTTYWLVGPSPRPPPIITLKPAEAPYTCGCR